MSIVEARISDVATDAARRYAHYVTLNRQFADLRDGLLPVYRHIIYAISRLDSTTSGRLFRTSKVSGDTIGNYHPHGDAAVNDAIANLTAVGTPVPPVLGEGNFGTRLGGNPAAPRYTEVRLTAYGRTFVKPEYLACVPHVWNYTNTEKIPVYLPAILPNILINGAFGIGYGAMACIPAFTPESVADLVDLAFTRDLTAKDCARILVPYFITNAKLETTSGLEQFYETGEGSFKVGPRFEVHGNDIHIVGFYELNIEKLAEAGNENPDLRDTIGDITSEMVPRVLVPAKPGRIKAVQEWLSSRLTFTKPLQANVLENDIPADYASDNETLPSWLEMYSMPGLVRKWCDYRIALEERMLNHVIGVRNKKMMHLDALISASSKLVELANLIRQPLQRPELVARVMHLLHVDRDGAVYILDTAIGRLSRLEEAELRKDKKDLHAEIRTLDDQLHNIVRSTADAVDSTFTGIGDHSE